MPEASDNSDDNDSDDEDQDGDKDDFKDGAHYRKPFSNNSEKKPCSNGWISMINLQPNEYIFLDTINSHNPIQIKFGLDSKSLYLWKIGLTLLSVNDG